MNKYQWVKKIVSCALVCICTISILSGCGDENMEIQELHAEKVVDQAISEEQEITEEQAITAIQNYCYKSNPDLKNIVDEGQYQVYWDVASSDEKEIVILYRSYTAAQVRYYINRNTGDTYVTEFVLGITDEEERTGENFNVKDYFN